MELIVIKVGLDAGLIGKQAFTMLLVMAIVTTMMTGPLLTLFTPPEQRQSSGACQLRVNRDGRAAEATRRICSS